MYAVERNIVNERAFVLTEIRIMRIIMPTAPLAQANYSHYSNFCQSFYANFFQPYSTKFLIFPSPDFGGFNISQNTNLLKPR